MHAWHTPQQPCCLTHRQLCLGEHSQDCMAAVVACDQHRQSTQTCASKPHCLCNPPPALACAATTLLLYQLRCTAKTYCCWTNTPSYMYLAKHTPAVLLQRSHVPTPSDTVTVVRICMHTCTTHRHAAATNSGCTHCTHMQHHATTLVRAAQPCAAVLRSGEALPGWLTGARNLAELL